MLNKWVTFVCKTLSYLIVRAGVILCLKTGVMGSNTIPALLLLSYVDFGYFTISRSQFAYL